MTRPTTIYFGPDSAPDNKENKVFLRFLLYSTSRRGRVIESIFLRVRSPESVQSFPIWVYGNKDLARGSGIFVGPEGVATNHHFLLPKGAGEHRFKDGLNKVEVVARLIGDQSDIILGEFGVTLTARDAEKISDGTSGIYFDWGGDNKDYVGWVETKPDESKLPMTPTMLTMIREQMARENQ